jgi:glycosyltransferase involved in cell wall biosynthesis
VYKIAIIHPNAGIDWNRNSATFAVELARHLDNYFEVELLSGADCGTFSRPIRSITNDVANLTTHPLINRVLQQWFARPQVAIEHLISFLPCVAYLLKHPVDLICPQNGYSSLFVATCVRALTGTPILFTEHNRLNRGNYIQHNLSLKPDRLVVLNPQVARYARNFAPSLPIDIIPYGIDTTEFVSYGQAMTTGLRQPIIICVAPLNRDGNTRIELTIEAVSRLPRASLLICGNGVDRDYFQDLGDRMLGQNRFQIRSFAYAQMPQVYRSAKVFTSASVDISGVACIEAMACGLPVVATDNSISRYLVGNSGATCDVTDLDTYTELLQNALVEHRYRHLPRKNAFRFSWPEITLIYSRVISHTVNHFYSRRKFKL